MAHDVCKKLTRMGAGRNAGDAAADLYTDHILHIQGLIVQHRIEEALVVAQTLLNHHETFTGHKKAPKMIIDSIRKLKGIVEKAVTVSQA